MWTSLPAEVKKQLHARLEELISHGQALDEPSIANVAAVSTAVGGLGGGGEDKAQVGQSKALISDTHILMCTPS